MARILLIDDEEGTTLAFKTLFEKKGHDFISEASGLQGLRTALKEVPDLILLDYFLPDLDGLSILREIKSARPEIAVIMITGMGAVKEAVEAMKLGAEHYFLKPVDLDELSLMVDKNLDLVRLRRENRLRKNGTAYQIIGKSEHVCRMTRLISLMAANSATTVLIEGETGTGKEIAARNIHSQGGRAEGPFVDINCASIPDTVFESELFGYEAGAFTDAKGTKKGLLEMAEGGTVFLDEVAEMPLLAQAKLLRVLETHSFRRLGGTRDIKVNIRVIAATNKDLSDLVQKGAFREDLYYRLNVLPLKMVPLRERVEDIPQLAEFFIDEISCAMNRKPPALSHEAGYALVCYPWPGNVRELKNVLERALIFCQSGSILVHDLLLPENGRASAGSPGMTLEEMELNHIKNVLARCENNLSRAARVLGISRSTLHEKAKKFGLSAPALKPSA
jgi:DNA-binding NtrC family response regulator